MRQGGSPEDTICAIATPVGEGGIGIVRISGVQALAVAQSIVRLRSGRALGTVSSHTLHLADIFLGHNSTDWAVAAAVADPGSAPIDECLVVYMKAPRSFTGEDVVEIHSHGSGIVLGQVCEACLRAGARLAEPGEFTKRAFLNGRLDLSQAEAVLDTITAKSRAGLKIAQRHLRGELRDEVDRLRAGLLGMLAHVEAGIDFVEEDINFIGRDQLLRCIQETVADIRRMVSSAEKGRLLREGARVVIVGRPNVGKSSLLNRLLREERAIVTSVPGTTRDLIEGSVVWNGVMMTLVDTAGVRETSDPVEQEGIRRTKSAQEDADLVLHVVDASELTPRSLGQDASTWDARREMVVINKCDVVKEEGVERLAAMVEKATACQAVCVSATTGFGLNRLRDVMCARLAPGGLDASEGVVVTNVRHRTALERALGALHAVARAAGEGAEPECLAVDLREAADALGEITGAITTDEIMERIFSEFCIGK